MARKPFVVLDAEILSSSVWSEAPHVRLVWITLLVLCDTDGYVGAALPGIARAAGISIEETQDAIDRLMAPDPYSRTQKDEGRRLIVADRGYQILNFIEHVDRLSAERKKSRDRVRRHRERRCNAQGVTVTLQSPREQGTENREVSKNVPEPPLLPAEEKAERATRATIQGLQAKLGSLIARLAEHPNSRRMVPDWSREVTSYTRQDGTKVRGQPDYRCVSSIDRLEKSIEDAEWWLEELERPNGQR